MGIGDYFGAAGDMFSGSQDPDEQNRALEREEQKRRREQDKEQARLLREQQAQQESQQRDLQRSPDVQSTPKPAVIENNEPAPLPKIDPDDPLSGVPDDKRTDILLRKYDRPDRKLTDFLGQDLSQDKRNEYVNVWKKRIRGASPDIRDTLLQMNMYSDPAIKDQVEEAKREFRQWMPEQRGRTMELRLEDTDSGGVAHTADYRPDRDGVAGVHKAVLYADEPVHVIKADNNLLSMASCSLQNAFAS